MSDFHKCTCSSCGQKIEYPPDGMGQTIPCPTCQKPLKLLPDIVISTAPAKKQPSIAPTRTEKGEREIYVSRVRGEPATEKQKEKLCYFGYPLKDGMTKGEASDALDECVKKYPLADRAYYGRPATEEQLAKIRKINASCAPDEPPFYDFEEEEPDEPLTYGEAKEVLRDWDLQQRRVEEEKELAYMESEKSKIEDMMIQVNTFSVSDYSRDVTLEEVAKAWALVKSDRATGAALPKQIEIENALEKLYPDLIKPIKPGVLWHNYCRHCRGQIEVMLPTNANLIKNPTPSDIISILVVCPHCHRETGTRGLDTFIFSCPHCSKQWSLLKSQAGKHLKCGNCQQDFLPVG